MRFSLLGPLEADADDGTPLVLARPSQRRTLAVLLLHSRHPPTRAQLIDELWGDCLPGDAEAALRVRMVEVRRALRGSRRLVTHRAGYSLRVEPGELDADAFSELARQGRAALDAGVPDDAARLLEQAGRLWREPPLVDLPDTPAMWPIKTGLLDQRRDASEWLLDARLALGQHFEVLAQIREAVANCPLAEHAHVQLMLALYRSGRKSEALDAYSRLRDMTVTEFGQDPGPEAREMLNQILNDNPDLQFRSRRTVIRSGNEAAWTPVCQLPATLPDFTGRAVAIEAVAQGLRSSGPSITVVTGPPGVGKTALAVKAAHLSCAEFPDGQLYVAAGGTTDQRYPAELLAELLRSLGVQQSRIPSDLAERAALYRSVLAGRRMLVLVDDAVSAAQVRPLLPGTAGSALLVTSNSRLLDLEGAHCVTITGLEIDESVSLLGRIAGPKRVAAEPDAAAAIAAACGGLPLALRIAGSRLAESSVLQLSDLAAAGADGERLLTELEIGDLSVGRRLDTSWLALDVYSRQILRALADLGLGSLPSSVVLAATAGAPMLAQGLVDSSLIMRDPATGDYSIAPLAGCHAAAQPVAAG